MSAEPARTPRYRLFASVMCESSNGDFVLHKDFTALTAKLERAERELQGARDRIEKIECVLREDIISASIIHAENEQRGHIHAIRRDAKFIKERCQAALQPAADGAAEGVGKSLTETRTTENALNDAIVENERLKEALSRLRKGWNDYTLHEIVDAVIGAPKE